MKLTIMLFITTLSASMPQDQVSFPMYGGLTASQSPSNTCRDASLDQSAWQDMLQHADAKLCTSTVVPE